jgi:hypothetical protein
MTTHDELPDREEQVARLLRAAAQSERAPESLHAQVAALRDRAPVRLRSRRPSWLRSPFAYVSVATPALGAGLVALLLALGGGAGAPSLAQAAAIGTRPPSAPAPAPDPTAPARLLTARVGRLHFPNWSATGGWRTVGARHDHLGNRAVTTVYYESGRHEIAYSIVSSPVLSGYDATEPYTTMRRHGRTVVIWREQGHTCVLSGVGISGKSLWRLVASSEHA